jgi:hypothetical protein
MKSVSLNLKVKFINKNLKAIIKLIIFKKNKLILYLNLFKMKIKYCQV